MVDVLELIAQKEVFLAVAFGVFVLVILILRFAESKMGSQKPISHVNEYEQIRNHIDVLIKQKKYEATTLQEIDALVRAFYTRAYGTTPDMEYAEMAAFCTARQQPLAAELANKLLENTYSGESLNSYTIVVLLSILKKLINEQEAKEQREKLNIPLTITETAPEVSQSLTPEQPEQESVQQPSSSLLQTTVLELPTTESPRTPREHIVKPEMHHHLQKARKITKRTMEKEHPAVRTIDNLDRIKLRVSSQKHALV